MYFHFPGLHQGTCIKKRGFSLWVEFLTFLLDFVRCWDNDFNAFLTFFTKREKAIPPFVKACNEGGIGLLHGDEYRVIDRVFVKASHGLKIFFIFVTLKRLLDNRFNAVAYLF